MPSRYPLSRRNLLSAASLAPLAPPPRRPNVLFILTDDQRQDTIHALGNPAIQTPNLDGLVRSGVTFRNAYCMGGFSPAVCLPSRMMILRGRSWFSVREQPEDAPNFPRSMGEAGYLTYHLGKRGNEDLRTHKFFDLNYYVEPDDEAERRAGQPGRQVAERAIDFLRQWKKDGSKKPFFMYLAGPAPHDPRVAPPEYLARYNPETLPLPPNFQPFHPFDNGELLIRDEKLAAWPRTGAEIRRHLRDYYADITYLDEQIGRILRTLDEIGERGRTLIVFTSDQGIAIGSHGLMGKQNLYEHSMRPGLILSGPGIPAGKSVDAFAYLFDIYPTVCDLVGAPVPPSLEGLSLGPVIRGRRRQVRDSILLAYRDFQRAIRRGRWKLIRYPQIDRTQLFDLEADPHEVHDLAGDPAQASRIRDLFEALRAEQRRFGDTLPLTALQPRPGGVDLDYFRAAK